MTILQVKHAICLFMPIYAKLKGLEGEEKLQVGLWDLKLQKHIPGILKSCAQKHMEINARN